MRIEVKPSALHHGIAAVELRAIVSYPEHRVGLNPRRPGSRPWLVVGAFDINEPYIEVIYDAADPNRQIVVHGMMLRASTVQVAGLSDHIDQGRIARRQRRQSSQEPKESS